MNTVNKITGTILAACMSAAMLAGCGAPGAPSALPAAPAATANADAQNPDTLRIRKTNPRLPIILHTGPVRGIGGGVGPP